MEQLIQEYSATAALLQDRLDYLKTVRQKEDDLALLNRRIQYLQEELRDTRRILSHLDRYFAALEEERHV